MTSWCLCDDTDSTSETVKPDAARTGSLVRRVESIAKPAEPLLRLGRFLFPARRKCSIRDERLFVIFNHQLPRGRSSATRAGWNDGAWGRPHRKVESSQLSWYERGFAAGLVFRH